MSGKILSAKYDGQTYQIPEIWIVGFCTGARARNEPSTVADAVSHWAYQKFLESLDTTDED